MLNFIDAKKLLVKDISISGLTILIISTLVANLHNPLWGVIYAFGNILTLVLLNWLYQDAWNHSQ